MVGTMEQRGRIDTVSPIIFPLAFFLHCILADRGIIFSVALLSVAIILSYLLSASDSYSFVKPFRATELCHSRSPSIPKYRRRRSLNKLLALFLPKFR